MLGWGLLGWGLLGLGSLGVPSPAIHGATAWPVPPLCTTQQPTDGEHITGLYSFDLMQTYPSATWARVVRASLTLWVGSVQFGLNSITVDTEGLPNGENVLSVEVHGASGLLAITTFSVDVENPLLSAQIDASNPGSVELQVDGLSHGQIYVVLAGNKAESTYHPAFGITLPLATSDTESLASGVFCAIEADDTSFVETVDLGSLAAADCVYLLLLIYDPVDGWIAAPQVMINP